MLISKIVQNDDAIKICIEPEDVAIFIEQELHCPKSMVHALFNCIEVSKQDNDKYMLEQTRKALTNLLQNATQRVSLRN